MRGKTTPGIIPEIKFKQNRRLNSKTADLINKLLDNNMEV